MKQHKFGKLAVTTSLLGFGCMRFPQTSEGNIDEVEAERMLQSAIDAGVNYIDTAYPYHNGESEPFVGKVLKKYPRDEFYLATKLPVWKLESQEDAKATFYEQLQRLQVDYVDFYLLHALDASKWQKVLDLDILTFLVEMKKQGKIRNLGFSFHDDFEVFKTIIEYRDWDFCQVQLNYMDTDIQAGLQGHDLAQSLNVPMIVMEPIKGGKLACLPDDIETKFKQQKQNASIASWALRWAASLPNVYVVLSGMSTFEQVDDNLATFTNFEELNQQEKVLVDEVASIIRSRTRNGCTGCNYCMPCPFGVQIPMNFKLWNEDGMYNEFPQALQKYENLKEASANNCKNCGACEKMCPQQIPIRDDLKKMVTYFRR